MDHEMILTTADDRQEGFGMHEEENSDYTEYAECDAANEAYDEYAEFAEHENATENSASIREKLRNASICISVTAATYIVFFAYVYDTSRFTLSTALFLLSGAFIVCGVIHAAVKESFLSGVCITVIPYGIYCVLAYPAELLSLKLTYFAALYAGLMTVVDSVLCLVVKTKKGEEFLFDIHDLQDTPAKVLLKYSGIFFLYIAAAATGIATR